MLEGDLIDQEFVAEHTLGIEDLVATRRALDWADLEPASGASTAQMRTFGELVGRGADGRLCLEHGRHPAHVRRGNRARDRQFGPDRGFVGRDKCGLMPESAVIRVYRAGPRWAPMPHLFRAARRSMSSRPRHWASSGASRSRRRPGLTAPDMIDAAERGDLDVLVAMGGNFREAMPDPQYVDGALANYPAAGPHRHRPFESDVCRFPPTLVILLPAMTRYEIPGGVTQTSTERRIMFSPEIEGRRIGEARPEWQVFTEIAGRVRPDLCRAKFRFRTRRRSATKSPGSCRPTPASASASNRRSGPVRGPHLCAGWDFPTTNGRAAFSMVSSRMPRSRRECSPWPPGAGSNSTRWSTRHPIR